MAMTSDVHYHDQGQANETYHFKILVPSVAAGAIIGKEGGIIARLQRETGATVKMSKATDFYPGTKERVCLITGTVEGIIKINEFIMEKVKEKPDLNAKMAIDFDHNQSVEREKQVKILVPNCTAGMIIGKSGCYVKQIKEESGAYVQISQKYNDHVLAERCITVIGEMESNKIACRMILAKIVEDPQSGCCLNISYADIVGPIANSSPTGSPFANSRSAPSSAVNSKNTSYSSNSSFNSLSPPTVSNSFQNPQIGATHSGIVPFPGVKMSDSALSPINATHIVETVKAMLQNNGYSEQAVLEISAAINTLANYGMLGLELGILNGLNGAPVVSLGMAMPSSASTNCPMSPGSIENQSMYTSATGASGMEATCNSLPPSCLVEAGFNLFNPTDSIENGMSRLDLRPAFPSPATSRSNDGFLVQTETAVFEPFHRTSPDLPSPNAAPLHMYNNSFGIGTGLNSDLPNLRKSFDLNDRQLGDETKIDIEVRENIVGAILGPEGKALADIQRFSGASIQISKKGIFAYGTRNRIVTITGLPYAVNTARHLIERQIAEEEAKRAKQNAMRDLC